jgi:hypothetical protein
VQALCVVVGCSACADVCGHHHAGTSLRNAFPGRIKARVHATNKYGFRLQVSEKTYGYHKVVSTSKNGHRAQPVYCNIVRAFVLSENRNGRKSNTKGSTLECRRLCQAVPLQLPKAQPLSGSTPFDGVMCCVVVLKQRASGRGTQQRVDMMPFIFLVEK